VSTPRTVSESASRSNSPTTTTTTALTTTTEIAPGSCASKPSRPREGIYTDKPVLRGQFHKWGAILYPPLLGFPLFLRAAAASQNTATSLVPQALLFSFAVMLITTISGTLHTYPFKDEETYMLFRRLDFMGIFVGIACFYSSMGRLTMGQHSMWMTIEGVVWTCAIVGTFLKWKVPDAPPLVNALVFIVQAWMTTPTLCYFFEENTPEVTLSMVLGGISCTLGALAYGLRFPRNEAGREQHEIIFGPHEAFHFGTLCMFAGFWYCTWSKITQLGGL
jgi:hemolysin III